MNSKDLEQNICVEPCKDEKNETIKGIKIKLYKAIASLVLMHEIENWTLNRSERGETKIAEMFV
jgi:hypothetical protein